MPGAIRKEVTRHRTAMTARRFVFHTAVSAASSLFDYFNQPGNATSHFYVRADGIIEQYVSTAYRAPAQLDGNHDCISVETQDMGPAFPTWSGSDVPAWSPAQLTALAQMSAWVAQVHSIPLTLLPDSVDGRTGFGYHRLGVDPWRVPAGELWSNAYGKVCPGDRRIAQIPHILAQASGDDMTSEEHNALMLLAGNIAEAGFPNLRAALRADMIEQGGKVLETELQIDPFPTFRQAMRSDMIEQGHKVVDPQQVEVLAAIANIPPVDPQALADALAPLLPPGVALTSEDVAAIAAAAAVAVNDELAARVAPQVV